MCLLFVYIYIGGMQISVTQSKVLTRQATFEFIICYRYGCVLYIMHICYTHKPASPRAAHGCSTSRGGRFGGVGGLASRLVLARGVVRLRPLPDSHHTILRSPHLVARSFISSSLLSFEATMQP